MDQITIELSEVILAMLALKNLEISVISSMLGIESRDISLAVNVLIEQNKVEITDMGRLIRLY